MNGYFKYEDLAWLKRFAGGFTYTPLTVETANRLLKGIREMQDEIDRFNFGDESVKIYDLNKLMPLIKYENLQDYN